MTLDEALKYIQEFTEEKGTLNLDLASTLSTILEQVSDFTPIDIQTNFCSFDTKHVGVRNDTR